MEHLKIIKIGGNVIDDPDQLRNFLNDFVKIRGPKILVHGGGKIANQLATDLGIEAKLIEGRRITDAATLRIVTMVYAGLVNKNIVALLQAEQCNALGLSGADGNSIQAKKRPVREIDYGYVGDIQPGSVHANLLIKLLEDAFVPVFSAITHDGKGQLLNTNADTIASELAVSLSAHYTCSLIYCFEKKGVLRDVNDEQSLIREINASDFISLQKEGVVSEGMIPKLHNAFEAIQQGVHEVFIGHSSELNSLETGPFGTRLKNSN